MQPCTGRVRWCDASEWTLLISPISASFFQISHSAGSADPWEKSNLRMNPRLTSNMTAYTPLSSPCSAPCSDTHTHTHTQRETDTHSSQFPSHLNTHKKVCNFSVPVSLFLHLTHFHTRELDFERRQREGEEEISEGRKSWRNVRSLAVTFDGDKCGSAAIQPLSLLLSRLPLPLSVSRWIIWIKSKTLLFRDVRGVMCWSLCNQRDSELVAPGSAATENNGLD